MPFSMRVSSSFKRSMPKLLSSSSFGFTLAIDRFSVFSHRLNLFSSPKTSLPYLISSVTCTIFSDCSVSNALLSFLYRWRVRSERSRMPDHSFRVRGTFFTALVKLLYAIPLRTSLMTFNMVLSSTLPIETSGRKDKAFAMVNLFFQIYEICHNYNDKCRNIDKFILYNYNLPCRGK